MALAAHFGPIALAAMVMNARRAPGVPSSTTARLTDPPDDGCVACCQLCSAAPSAMGAPESLQCVDHAGSF